MKENLKNKWINALRSGKYKQGKNRLRNKNNKFCCLRVLCDILIKEASELNLKWTINSCKSYNIDKFEYVVLPNYVSSYCYIHPIDESELIYMNDIYKISFNKIADWIEDNL